MAYYITTSNLHHQIYYIDVISVKSLPPPLKGLPKGIRQAIANNYASKELYTLQKVYALHYALNVQDGSAIFIENDDEEYSMPLATYHLFPYCSQMKDPFFQHSLETLEEAEDNIFSSLRTVQILMSEYTENLKTFRQKYPHLRKMDLYIDHTSHQDRLDYVNHIICTHSDIPKEFKELYHSVYWERKRVKHALTQYICKKFNIITPNVLEVLNFELCEECEKRNGFYSTPPIDLSPVKKPTPVLY